MRRQVKRESAEAPPADGIPYTVDAFDYAGQVPPRAFIESEDLSEDFGKQRLPDPQRRRDELPLNLSIVNFPDQPQANESGK